MLSAVNKASKKILRDFYELRFLQSSKKPLNRFLKFSIANAEETIFELLSHARPEFGLVSHYSDYENKPDCHNSWIVNVLDGIENFSRAIPYFSISIAVSQKNNNGEEEIIAGVVYIPALTELYFAEKGNGAWCQFSSEFQAGVSETRLRTSEKLLAQPLVFTNDTNFQEQDASIRMLGASSIALSYMAAARGDKCFLNYDKLSDLAAGLIIAKEAGAVIENDINLKRVIARKV
jgi:myo-inositol-1(or 4)-monophosphatase